MAKHTRKIEIKRKRVEFRAKLTKKQHFTMAIVTSSVAVKSRMPHIPHKQRDKKRNYNEIVFYLLYGKQPRQLKRLIKTLTCTDRFIKSLVVDLKMTI